MKLTSVLSGYFSLDGGPMFGVVPKVLWNKLNPADDHNLCQWAMRSLLIETSNRKILVDTGIGFKQEKKFRKMFGAEGPTATESLQKLSIPAESITDVFLTHFHFDHVGGALTKDEKGNIFPSFPQATYWSNEVHYDWAFKSNPREEASFIKENFVPLRQQGKLRMIDVQKDDIQWMDGMSVRFVDGHTTGMMVLSIPLPDQEKRLWYGADLIPSQWHVRRPYVMAYDMQPLKTLEEKERFLTDLIDREDVLFFEHDPVIEAATLRVDERGRFELLRSGVLEEFAG